MVHGSANLPGGIAAWLPSVCFILMEAHLEARRVAAGGGQLSEEVRKLLPEKGAPGGQAEDEGFDLEPDSDDESLDADAALHRAAGGDAFFAHLARDLGVSLASALLLILRGFD
eukprot:6196037-Pleurochrysis_carterae.AAC.1